MSLGAYLSAQSALRSLMSARPPPVGVLEEGGGPEFVEKVEEELEALAYGFAAAEELRRA